MIGSIVSSDPGRAPRARADRHADAPRLHDQLPAHRLGFGQRLVPLRHELVQSLCVRLIKRAIQAQAHLDERRLALLRIAPLARLHETDQAPEGGVLIERRAKRLERGLDSGRVDQAGADRQDVAAARAIEPEHVLGARRIAVNDHARAVAPRHAPGRRQPALPPRRLGKRGQLRDALLERGELVGVVLRVGGLPQGAAVTLGAVGARNSVTGQGALRRGRGRKRMETPPRSSGGALRRSWGGAWGDGCHRGEARRRSPRGIARASRSARTSTRHTIPPDRSRS